MAGRKKADVGKVETDAEKFDRLAVQRVNMAIKYIGLVGNLAGPGYERSPEKVEQLLAALQGAVDRAKERFEGKTQTASGFRFSDSGS